MYAGLLRRPGAPVLARDHRLAGRRRRRLFGDSTTSARAYLDGRRATATLTARVVGALWWDRERGAEQIAELVERRDAGRVGRFAATTVKIMQDGVAENFTAAMLEPYLDGVRLRHGTTRASQLRRPGGARATT